MLSMVIARAGGHLMTPTVGAWDQSELPTFTPPRMSTVVWGAVGHGECQSLDRRSLRAVEQIALAA